MLILATLSPLLFGTAAICAAIGHDGVELSAAPSAENTAAINSLFWTEPEQAQWSVGVDVGADDTAEARPPHHPRPPRVPHPTPPHFPHHRPSVNKTIYQILNDTPEYSRLLRLVNLNNATIDLLHGSNTNITFFAPSNSAFPKPRHGHPHGPPHVEDEEEDGNTFSWLEKEDPAGASLEELLSAADALDADIVAIDDGDEKEKKRALIKKLIGAVLSYHVIPQPLPPHLLLANTTYATNLTIGHGFLDGEALRVRVAPKPFGIGISINLYSIAVSHPIASANGFLYKISLPLLPPPAVFQELFLVPSAFSITTSAIQRTGLTEALERVYKHRKGGEKGTISGATALTFFAPSNRAFEKLPRKLRFFLFSPFGQRALKKLLQFHIVPGIVLHSDYFHNATTAVDAELSAGYAALPERPLLENTLVEETPFGTVLPHGPRHRDRGHHRRPAPATRRHCLPPPPSRWRRCLPFHPPPHHCGPRGGKPGPHQPRHVDFDVEFVEDADEDGWTFVDPVDITSAVAEPMLEVNTEVTEVVVESSHVRHFGGEETSVKTTKSTVRTTRTQPVAEFFGTEDVEDSQEQDAILEADGEDTPFVTSEVDGAVVSYADEEDEEDADGELELDDPSELEQPSTDAAEDRPRHRPPPSKRPRLPTRRPSPRRRLPHHRHARCIPPPPPRRICRLAPPPPRAPHPPHHAHAPLAHVHTTLNVTVPTLLTNHTLSVAVVKIGLPKLPHAPPKYLTRVLVNGRPVQLADAVANNGAIHAVDRLLNPLKKGGKHPKKVAGDEGGDVVLDEEDEDDDDDFADWEDWLVRWANED